MITRRTKVTALISSISAGIFTNACAAEVRGHAGLAGRWGGVLGTGAGALRLVLEIAPDQGIVLVSVDQGNARIPATGGTCSARELDLVFGSVRGRLKLMLNAQNALAGTWSQGQAQDIVLTRLSAGQHPSVASPAPFVDFQSEVNSARTQSGTPAIGAAFLARKDGKLAAREAVSGVLVQGQSQVVREGLKWHIGSITKSMTATLVARLVETGLMSWDMTLKDAFGTLAPDIKASYRNKTVSQLMSGQSGMPTNIGPLDFVGHAGDTETPTQRRKVWVQQAFAMEPQNGFVYPNNGYVLAGALCEKVTGKAYETLMMEEVFTPLGLTSGGFGPPAIGNPQGHRKALLGGRIMTVGIGDGADNPAAMAPAGRAHMTLPDLAKFALAHSEGHQGLRNTYLKQETWQYLHTPPVLTSNGNDYAFGWVARSDGTLWHNGSNTYWLGEVAFDPRKSHAACACASYADAGPAVGRLLAAGMAQGTSA